MRNWLIELRKSKGLTQQQLSVETGLSQNYISSIENGVRSVPVWTAKKIAAALGFDWQRFYEDEGGEPGDRYRC